MATFPTSLPTSLQTGYSLKPTNPVVRTEMEGGPPKQRRRFTQAPTNYTIQWVFSISEFAIFEKWHKEDIFDGASWFDDLEIVNGQGVTLQTARFTKMWTAKMRSGKDWVVNANVETKTRPLNP